MQNTFVSAKTSLKFNKFSGQGEKRLLSSFSLLFQVPHCESEFSVECYKILAAQSLIYIVIGSFDLLRLS